MYIVRFIRNDGHPTEKYYYHNYEDAAYHLSLFIGDTSSLYRYIILSKQ